MYALHALWRADGRLALWAEDAAAYRTGRPAAARPGAGAHPYACAAGEVARLLGAIGPGLDWLAGQADERWTGLLLPTLGERPVPSPDLPVGSAPRGVALGAWRVPTLLFGPAEAAQLLGSLHDPRWPGATVELPGGESVELAYGASLRWLSAVHDLAWRLVGRGRLLPALAEERPGEWYARWRPAPDAPARRELAALAAGCPPVCRAEHRPGAGAPEAPAAAPTGTELATGLLDTLVDQEARAALVDLEPPAEPWLAALHAADGRLRRPPATDLPERLTVWGAARPADSPVRLNLRLTEPLGPDGLPYGGDRTGGDRTGGDRTGASAQDDDPGAAPETWRLDLLLQAADRPSLVVPAADLWTEDAGYAALTRTVSDPAAALLAELERAARVHPPLRSVLLAPRPTGVDLDRAGALRFLREAAPVLTRAGFGVLLPAWWQRRPRLGLALTAAPATAPGSVRRTARVDRDAVLNFQWQLSIGELTVTEAELAELVAAQQGLVRLRGRWIEVDQAQLAAAVRFLAARGRGVMEPVELLRLALDDGAVVDGLPVTAVRAAGPIGELLAGRPGPADRVPELPDGFTGTLRPYQRRGLAWLDALGRLGLGAVLADDMGLGKTVQTLALLALEQQRGATGPTLLVCPMSLVGNWQREAARFAPGLRVHVHHGADRSAPDRSADLVITTYGLVQRDAAELRAIRWRRIVADEAQHIKNPAARQSRALRSLRSGPRIALTGTPVENRLAELHAVLDFANPGLFGSAESFKERFSIPVEQAGSVEAAARLRRLSGPFLLRRSKSDPQIAQDLPAKQEFTVHCSLTAEQAGLYRAVVADLLERLRGMRGVERKGAVLAAIGRLKQVCNHPAQLLHDGTAVAGRSGKVERLVEVLEEALAEGDRALVFTQYAEFGAMLQPHLRERLGEDVPYLHGGVPKGRRDELVERFQRPDGARVFLLSLRAGGTGLNLSAANQVIHLDRWWNPAVEDQATDRAHRIGQRRDVQVRRLVCVGTVEERIDELLAAKRGLADAVIGGGEEWLAELSAERLRELLSLSADAIGE
ncbi:DEAD/DEAH box helicase [Kitasatospora sp. CM 4170]|uniref:DEAD/DEAH box helicase n=1 Tax=Kitasatospora TaxID=2063 RepID=UPI0028B245E3|nr:DEAD/DEAH box helicase [Kitasatospora sp. CM 4170]WNM48981.1 DEAD/DEAH box helicase [Kitasatospora sp. CM 4170]